MPNMFMPYDLRPIVEITMYTLAGFSTLVVAIRYGCKRTFDSQKLKVLGSTRGCGLLEG
jgi:hypothetical protein